MLGNTAGRSFRGAVSEISQHRVKPCKLHALDAAIGANAYHTSTNLQTQRCVQVA